MMGRKSQHLISEEESFEESDRKFQCLYDISCADYKNKVFVENAWAAFDKVVDFEEGKEFSYFLCSIKLKRRSRKIFYKCLPTSKNMRFIIKTCRLSKPSKVCI